MRFPYQFLSGAILFLASAMSVGEARAAIDNTAYGILAFSADQSSMTNNIVSFDLISDAEPVFRRAVPFYDLSTAGAYGDGAYYVAVSQSNGSYEVPKSLARVDLEKGSYTTVGELTGYSNLINDMTYDWSTSTMYAISRINDQISGLYTINLRTAKSRLVANLDRKFFTLAASYSGQLYGISFAGDFCAIDKATGEVTVIGATGHYPEKFQSMEFDHETRTLYWVASTRRLNESGSIELSECFVGTVDPATGAVTRLRNFGDNQIAGLYIPSFAAPDNCPAAVTAPEATAASEGANSATLSWINPSETFGGEPLKALTKVEIKRDGAVVGTVSNAEPGKRSSFTDNIGGNTGAAHTWLITPYSNNGAGASVAVTAYVGRDVPAAVSGIAVERLTSNSATISWQPVTTGANGGWCAPATITYRVVRNPGETVIADGIVATECTDNGAEVSGTYTYSITATSSCGTSEPAVSGSITLGPVLGMPYSCEFSETGFGQWTPVDGNGDGNTWTQMYLSWAHADIAYIGAARYILDDWLVSNPMEFEPNSIYKVKIRAMANGEHPVAFYLLSGSDVNSPLQEAGSLVISRTSESDFAEHELQFATGADIGNCNFAIHNTALMGSSNFYLDRIEIEKLVDSNLAATAITGNAKPIEGNTYLYTVTVANKGTQPFSAYTVEIVDGAGTVLGSTAVAETLAGGETAKHAVSCSFPLGCELTAIYGRVKATGDQIASDDRTPALALTILPLGSSEEIVIGGDGVSTSTSHPLNLYNKYGASQNIYQASEIGLARGRISDIRIGYKAYSDVSNIGVRIYLANTARVSNQEGWIPDEDYTLVYDGHVDIGKDGSELNLELSNAFEYTGGNLAMLAVTSMAESDRSYLSLSQPYYYSPVEGNKAITYGNYSAPFETTATPTSQQGNSCVTFIIRSGGASVTGIVTDTRNNPVEGAEISIPEIHAQTLSGADGSFRFDFVPNGQITLIARMPGYKDSDAVSVTVSDNDETANLSIEKLPVYSVGGRVIAPDSKPVAGADVSLDGYTGLSATTGADGTFSFSNVVISPETTVTVSKDWFVDYTTTFDLNADKKLGDITLGYAHFAPAALTVDASGNAASLTWNDPAAPAELVYDSGTASSQIGFSESVGTIVIGTAFRTPMTLSRVSWFTTFEGGPHNSVNIYIYDLDSEGNPTGTLLYSERAVFNTDGQWTELELKEPVDAPRGCFVAVNYPGFHAIGVDGDSKTFPFRENTYAFSTDYTSGDFMYFSKETLSGNLMIRAAGSLWSAEGMKAGATEMPDGHCSYNVWRANGYDTPQWTRLTDSPIGSRAFSDATWHDAAAGVYRYAVTAVYPDGSESEKAESSFIARDMIGSLALMLSTNSTSGSAAGATVTIGSTDPADARTAVADKAGHVTFNDIWRDNYTVSVSLPGYEKCVRTADLLAARDFVISDIELKEIIATPVNTALTGNYTSGFLFTWNESGEIADDFEAHEPFTVASPGEVGWLYRDGDGSRTFAEADFSFPGRTQPCSFMVFNPSLTTPPMAAERSASLPYDGDAELASFAGRTGSDDWFISPRLTYHNDFEFSFMARGYSQTYGEVIRVGYSLTDPDPASFIWLDDYVDVPMQVWTPFEYTVPGAAKYVAVNCISPDGFTLFIDDAVISSGKGFAMNTAVTGPEVVYAVSLDGKEVARTPDCSYLFTNLAEGRHVAEVKAVYASGESASAQEVFGESGIDAVGAGRLTVSPNPAPGYTVVDGAFDMASLYDLSGRRLMTFDGTQRRLELDRVTPGLYLLVIDTPDGRHATVKLTVR